MTALLQIPLAELDHANPLQLRRTPAAAEQEEGLRQSIRSLGVLQPILVRRAAGGATFGVVDGHRRVAAARDLGIDTIPAMPVALDERDATAAGVATNIARAGLAPVDQWRAMAHLVELGWTPNGAALALGIGERLARRLAKLGTLHPDLIAAIEAHGMPPDQALATIANAPMEAQQTAIRAKDCWQTIAKGRRQPLWWNIQRVCSVQRIPSTAAIFQLEEAVDVTWEEDLFEPPGSPRALTTRDVKGFLAAQEAALAAKAARSKTMNATTWNVQQGLPDLPKGWKLTQEVKAIGVMRWAAVVTHGASLGQVHEVYALPPPPPPAKKGKGKPAAESAEAASESAKPPSESAQACTKSAGTAPAPSDDAIEDEEEDAAFRDVTPPQPAPRTRQPVTEAGRILIAQAKTAAIRCALRDRRDHAAGDILAVLVLALAGDNVEVRGSPHARYGRTRFHDLAARLVEPDGTPAHVGLADMLGIAAEAAARMIVCGPRDRNDQCGSGAVAEWIGAMLEAERDMPRLDTPEILATVAGDALKEAAIAIGDAGKGTTRALRERLAGHAEGLKLPGSAFSAPGPIRPKEGERPEGHVGPFPCEACSDPEYCIEERCCERTDSGLDETEEDRADG